MLSLIVFRLISLSIYGDEISIAKDFLMNQFFTIIKENCCQLSDEREYIYYRGVSYSEGAADGSFCSLQCEPMWHDDNSEQAAASYREFCSPLRADFLRAGLR
jgi:hypothetical protein